MESQPQNPEFRNDRENFYPCIYLSSIVTAAAVRSKAVILQLLLLLLLLFLSNVSPCFFFYSSVFLLVLQSSCYRREDWLLYFNCIFPFMCASVCLSILMSVPHGAKGWSL